MKPEFKDLRIKQLARLMENVSIPRGNQRPQRGWIAAIREVSGVSLRELASKLGVRHQSVAALEKAEAEDRVTLKHLRQAAEALNCELVYALIPKKGTIRDLAEAKIREEVSERVLAVEHTMALEEQAPGKVKEKIDEETKRILNRNSRKRS